MGKSGRAIIDALIAGESDPAKLAALADTRIRSSQNKLRHQALSGRIRRHHRLPDQNLHLQQINALDAAITEIDREVDTNRSALSHRHRTPDFNPWHQHAQCTGHPIGDRHRHEPIPDGRASDLVGGLCPGNDESAGKRRSTRLRKGRWLKTTLVQCAWSASRKKASYTQAQFHRLRARRGAKKAVCAVAASICHRCLSHAQGRHPVSGPRPRSLQPPFKAAADKSFAQALGRSWLCR